MDTGRTTADPAQRNIRSDTHRTEERLIDRHNDTARDLRRLALAIDWDDPTPERGELVGQRAGIGPLAIESPVEREVDLQNAHFEHVTRHRALDLDRSGEHMRPRAAVLHLTEDVALVLRDGASRLLKIGPKGAVAVSGKDEDFGVWQPCLFGPD